MLTPPLNDAAAPAGPVTTVTTVGTSAGPVPQVPGVKRPSDRPRRGADDPIGYVAAGRLAKILKTPDARTPDFHPAARAERAASLRRGHKLLAAITPVVVRELAGRLGLLDG